MIIYAVGWVAMFAFGFGLVDEFGEQPPISNVLLVATLWPVMVPLAIVATCIRGH
jgi:hypothetical protein